MSPEKRAEIKARKAAYDSAHRKEHAAYQRKWCQKNPAAAKLIKERYLAQFKETHPILQWEFILKDGRKQYGRGRTAGKALGFMPWLKKEEIASVRQYNGGG
jgi:hypothetical protein